MNLIVTCPRNLEPEAESEIKKILNELDDQEPEISQTDMRGILMVNTVLEPLKIDASEKSKKLVRVNTKTTISYSKKCSSLLK